MREAVMVRCFFLIFALCSCSLFGQTVEIGTNVSKLYSKFEKEYSLTSELGVCPFFADTKILKIGHDPDPQAYPNLLCFVTREQKMSVFGAFILKDGEPYFFYDTDLDGILDFESKEYFLPGWVSFFFPVARDDIAEFVKLSGEIYGIFESTDGPDGQTVIKSREVLTDKLRSVQTKNRDLYFALWSYKDGVLNPPLGIGLMKAMFKRIDAKDYDKLPLLYLYLGESYYSNGDYENAAAAFKDLVRIHPTSKLGSYYLAVLENMVNKNDKPLKQFKKENPDFWLLKTK